MPIIPRSGESINAEGLFTNLTGEEITVLSERYLRVEDVIWEMYNGELLVALYCNLIQ